MHNPVYNLSLIDGINLKECFQNNTIEALGALDNSKLIHKNWAKNDKIYHILKYVKTKIPQANFETEPCNLGLVRSVIYSNQKINVFSPPKAINNTIFINKYREEDCVAEEFIEGTMINVFYDTDINKWEIASKTSVGGNIAYFQDQPTFSELFNECCEELAINMDNFCKEYCYSFVMQHPKNKFVLPIIQKSLYLIAIYKIDNETYTIYQLPREEHSKNLGNVRLPIRYELISYNELVDVYGSMNTNINILGVMIYHKDGARTKIRNPNYECLKHLRGNNPKIQYQYLCLRKLDQVANYLKFFPESKALFSVFRVQIHIFTDNLYTNYIKCYIKKRKPLLEFPKQFRTHMYNLHIHYLSIVANKGYINKQVVINYINALEPAKLMYSLNFHLR